MSLRTGLAVQLTSPVDEGTYGVAPTLTGAKFSAFDTEGLALKKAPVQGKGIVAGKRYPLGTRRVITDWTAGGPIVMDLPAQHLQQWLFPMFGSYGQAASALTEDETTGAYSAVHAPGDLESHSFSLQKGMPFVDTGGIAPVTYVGCKITEWEIPSVTKGEIVKLNLTVDARNELGGDMNSDPLNGSLPGLVSYTAPPGGVFHFREASIYTGGTLATADGVTTVTSPTLAGNIKSFSVKHTVPMNTERYHIGLGGFKDEQLQNDLRAVSGQLVVEWLSSLDYYNDFTADTPFTLQLQLIGPGIGTGSDFSTLEILLPVAYLDDGSPKTESLDVITQTLPFTVLDGGAHNVIQATYWTVDAA